MATPSHKNNTKNLADLTPAEQAKSLTAQISNLNNAIQHHVDHAADPVRMKKCIKQVYRLLGRLLEEQ